MEKDIHDVIYKTRCKDNISEEHRREYVYRELELAAKQCDTKIITTDSKALIFRFLNVASSMSIIVCSAIIVGLEAASECINIPVIVLSSIIFAVEGTHKLLSWGPRGIKYKDTSVRLKRTKRQIRNLMLFFHTFTTDVLLTMVTQFWDYIEELDMDLFVGTTSAPTTYSTGLDIESAALNRSYTQNPSSLNNTQNNTHNNTHNNTQNNNNNTQNNNNNTEPNTNSGQPTHSPHIYVHIDGINTSKDVTMEAEGNLKLSEQNNTNENNTNNTNEDNKTQLPQIDIDEDESPPVQLHNDENK